MYANPLAPNPSAAASILDPMGYTQTSYAVIEHYAKNASTPKGSIYSGPVLTDVDGASDGEFVPGALDQEQLAEALFQKSADGLSGAVDDGFNADSQAIVPLGWYDNPDWAKIVRVVSGWDGKTYYFTNGALESYRQVHDAYAKFLEVWQTNRDASTQAAELVVLRYLSCISEKIDMFQADTSGVILSSLVAANPSFKNLPAIKGFSLLYSNQNGRTTAQKWRGSQDNINRLCDFLLNQPILFQNALHELDYAMQLGLAGTQYMPSNRPPRYCAVEAIERVLNHYVANRTIDQIYADRVRLNRLTYAYQIASHGAAIRDPLLTEKIDYAILIHPLRNQWWAALGKVGLTPQEVMSTATTPAIAAKIKNAGNLMVATARKLQSIDNSDDPGFDVEKRKMAKFIEGFGQKFTHSVARTMGALVELNKVDASYVAFVKTSVFMRLRGGTTLLAFGLGITGLTFNFAAGFLKENSSTVLRGVASFAYAGAHSLKLLGFGFETFAKDIVVTIKNADIWGMVRRGVLPANSLITDVFVADLKFMRMVLAELKTKSLRALGYLWAKSAMIQQFCRINPRSYTAQVFRYFFSTVGELGNKVLNGIGDIAVGVFNIIDGIIGVHKDAARGAFISSGVLSIISGIFGVIIMSMGTTLAPAALMALIVSYASFSVASFAAQFVATCLDA